MNVVPFSMKLVPPFWQILRGPGILAGVVLVVVVVVVVVVVAIILLIMKII
jgi:hypothetical protein